MNKIIDGNKIAEKIFFELKKMKTPTKELSAILVGSDPGSLSFLKQKKKIADSLGVKFKLYKFSSKLTQKQLENKVRSISQRKSVGALIVQIPLPKKYNRISVLNAIGIEKDVDVLNGETTSVLPPATGALKRILKEVKFSLAGKKVVVVGSGMLIGQPVAKWLMSKVRKLTILNKSKLDVKAIKEADLLILGTGVPGLIKGKHLKKGVVVIDYGYGKIKGKVSGDAHFPSTSKVAKYITPTPGGTGPIVVAQLMDNFYHLS